MATSRIPNAIDGLLALCNGQTDSGDLLDGVAIYDGPPYEDPSSQRQLYIGYDEERSDVDIFSVEGNQEWQTMGGPREETFSLLCAAVARSGDLNLKAERDRAFGMMAAVERLIRINESGADSTLGGAVLVAHVSGAIKLLQLQTQNGAYAKVSFHIQCIARI
jgi:hypothetical protein